FFTGDLGTVSPVPFNLDPDTGEYTFEMDNYTGAQNNDGALVIVPSLLQPPANQANFISPYNTEPYFHHYDYGFFYRNLERNVVDRVNAYNSR
ncbi:MAG: hypothetical protein WBE74_16785, partial [Terracidiphilus sp.]